MTYTRDQFYFQTLVSNTGEFGRGDQHSTDALNSLEVNNSYESATDHSFIRVASWNVERCKYIDASVELLKEICPDVLLLTEMDCGMARSGNRHTVNELSRRLGMNSCFGVEFIELGHGNQSEQEFFLGRKNEVGIHGNAILANRPLENCWQVRLRDGDIWEDQAWHSPRIGSRLAVGCSVRFGNRSFDFVCAHLESMPGEERRAQQMKEVLDSLAIQGSGSATILAGDFNPSCLPGNDDFSDWFSSPHHYEPLFGVVMAHGLEWMSANEPKHTRRQLRNGFPKQPFKKLDWIFVKDALASHPRTFGAVDRDGNPISDHEIISCDIIV